MKKVLIGLAALALTATAASASPLARHKPHNDGYHGKPYASYESVRVKRSKAHLAWVKRQAWADGRITFRERLRIRHAERQLAFVLRRSHRRY